jgi:cysteinyl-tRNA synthetase
VLLGLGLASLEVREVDRRRSAADLDPAEVELIEGKIADRTQARMDRNWGRADEIRAELEALGVQVTDTPAGPTWELT